MLIELLISTMASESYCDSASTPIGVSKTKLPYNIFKKSASKMFKLQFF